MLASSRIQRIVMLTVVTVVALVTSANGALLDISYAGYPDIHSSNNGIVYLASSDSFTATGIPITLNFSSSSYNIMGAASILINADIDGSGDIGLGGGTLTIKGSVPGLSIPDGVLLTGDLLDFGFLPSSDAPGMAFFDFLFNKTGGSLSDYYGQIYVQMAAFAGVSADDWTFGGDFTVTEPDVDTKAITPEPASLAIWSCIGFAAIGMHRFRRRRLAS